mgnify:FL=1
MQHIGNQLILYAHALGVLVRMAARHAWPVYRGRIRWRRWLTVLGFLPLILGVQVVHWIALILDECLFPGYRRMAVRQPLFIVGVPRSGTTLLQRVMAADDTQFTTLRTWELVLAPSILQKRLLLGLSAVDRRLPGRPLHRALDWAERKILGEMDHIHRLSLHAPEEDFLLLLPVMFCFALVVAFPSSEDLWRVSRFDRAVPANLRHRVMAFYKGCLQRHLYVMGRGRRLLSKNVSFVPFLASMRETFPDLCVLACRRDPVKVVPSQISSLLPGLHAFGYVDDDPEFRKRILEMLVFYYGHMDGELGKLPSERRITLDIREIRDGLEAAIDRVYGRLGLSIAPGFAERLRGLARESAAYRSSHHYSLEQFGWTQDEIAAMFEAVCRGETGGVAER